jgi:hypothetical protein
MGNNCLQRLGIRVCSAISVRTAARHLVKTLTYAGALCGSPWRLIPSMGVPADTSVGKEGPGISQCWDTGFPRNHFGVPHLLCSVPSPEANDSKSLESCQAHVWTSDRLGVMRDLWKCDAALAKAKVTYVTPHWGADFWYPSHPSPMWLRALNPLKTEFLLNAI